MGKINLLDCTLRDGGYINDWRFGEDAIKGLVSKIADTNIEMLEVGFIKGTTYDPNRSVFPDTETFKHVIGKKSEKMLYVGMLDMSGPVAMDKIGKCDPDGIDGIRVIFKKKKTDEAYEYCKYIKEQGYKLFVNFVGTDQYTDKEFIEGIERFNDLDPDGMTIVDTFGVIKRKQFKRLVAIADNNLKPGIMLCYHAHNNLQQAFGNAEAMVEMNLKRDIVIDACIFGMGRGAGNLNLELFAEFMNENYDTDYKIEPMLEIMDRYLQNFYKTKFWGYSLPLYLSASLNCHPNYAIYLAEKDSLPVAPFHDLLAGISDEDKMEFSKDKAEAYYRKYLENPIDDSSARADLAADLKDKKVLVLAPGMSIVEHKDEIRAFIDEGNTAVIAVNFLGGDFKPDYVFSSNMRRYAKLEGKIPGKSIVTSNMRDMTKSDYVLNFATYEAERQEIHDNSGVMILKFLAAIGIEKVSVAGMDGYSSSYTHNYFDSSLEYDFSKECTDRNSLISDEIKEIKKVMNVEFITPTHYSL